MQPNPAPQKADARAWGTGGTNKGDKTAYAEGWVVTRTFLINILIYAYCFRNWNVIIYLCWLVITNRLEATEANEVDGGKENAGGRDYPVFMRG